jgi:hypothetical protein
MTPRRANPWAKAGRFAAQAAEAFMLFAIGAASGAVVALHVWGR